QHAGPDAGSLARHVAHVGRSVDEIDVGVTALEIERAIARGLAAKGMTAGIARRIGFGFDDPPARSAVEILADQDLADEVARQRDRGARELVAPQKAERWRRDERYRVDGSPCHRQQASRLRNKA